MPGPKAAKIDQEIKTGDVTLHDNYAWMRDKNWPKEVKDEKIIAHLKEENKYTELFFQDLDEIKDKFFNEIKGRIKLADQSAYTKIDNYFYYIRTEEDKGYPIYCRKFGSMDSVEEIILDVNKLAEGKKFTQVKAVAINPSHSKLAYNVDYAGDERYLLQVMNLENNELMPDQIANISGNIIWHRNMQGFFYTPLTEEMRVERVMYHELGNDPINDKQIFEEKNPKYFISIDQSASREYLFVAASDHSDTEISFLPLQEDALETQLIQARKKDIEYSVEHNGDYFYMLTNDAGPNFRIIRSLIKELSYNNWSEYIPLDSEKGLSSFDITEDFLILNYRIKGLPLIKMLHLKDGTAKVLTFPDESYTAKGYSTNFVENDLRMDYSSLARPNTTYTYEFEKNKLNILKEQVIPSGHNPSDYEVKRIWADSNGAKVPVSLVYKKALLKQDGTNPLYLYGYGSYGIGMDPSFKASILSLVDRGFVYAIAHIRGGDDLGYSWYLDGKLLKKKHSFEDFIACSEKLIEDKYTSKGNIVIMGGSAGGMLIGTVINMKPELYKAAIAHVPFVDVLNTMLDANLPLTPPEYNEWGNPQDKEYFEYIQSYSPYENISKQAYPYIFATTGINDPRVGYWEAAKWVAKLREISEDSHPILLKTNLDSGHQGASDRFEYLKEVAEDFAFISKVFKIKM